MQSACHTKNKLHLLQNVQDMIVGVKQMEV